MSHIDTLFEYKNHLSNSYTTNTSNWSKRLISVIFSWLSQKIYSLVAFYFSPSSVFSLRLFFIRLGWNFLKKKIENYQLKKIDELDIKWIKKLLIDYICCLSSRECRKSLINYCDKERIIEKRIRRRKSWGNTKVSDSFVVMHSRQR